MREWAGEMVEIHEFICIYIMRWWVVYIKNDLHNTNEKRERLFFSFLGFSVVDPSQEIFQKLRREDFETAIAPAPPAAKRRDNQSISFLFSVKDMEYLFHTQILKHSRLFLALVQYWRDWREGSVKGPCLSSARYAFSSKYAMIPFWEWMKDWGGSWSSMLKSSLLLFSLFSFWMNEPSKWKKLTATGSKRGYFTKK